MYTFLCRTYVCLFLSYTDLFYMSYICIPFSVVHRHVLHVVHMYAFFCPTQTCSTCHTYLYLFFCRTQDLFYMSYICKPFSVLHRPVLHVIHVHTFLCRTQTCSTCHTYANLFLSYTNLFYMSYICICIPFSVVHRPVLHVIHMHTLYLSYTNLFYMLYTCIPFSCRTQACSTCRTHAYLFFCRTQTCSTCHTYGNLFMSYQRPILLVIRMHTLFSHTQACCTCNTSICVVSSAVRRPVVRVIHKYV